MFPDRRLIVALDDMSAEEALALAPRLVGEVDAIKVSYALVLRSGMSIVSSLSAFAPVMCDFKIADIPFMNGLIAREAFSAGATAVIAHAFPGREALSAVVEAAQQQGGEAWAVVEMSHPGSSEFISPATDGMVTLALSCGADGLIAPGTRPERIAAIRKQAGNGVQIATPGIGTQGGDGPAAIRAGATFLIVGRAIYQAPDPAGAAAALRATLPR